MRLPTVVTTAAAVALAAALASPAAQAQVDRTARFHVSIEGLQTTKWTSTSPEYTDCNGTHTSTGQGTEVLRFKTQPQKVAFRQLGRTIQVTYGTWDTHDMWAEPGFPAAARLTRRGEETGHVSGGWCGGATTEPGGPYDCGRRSTTAETWLRFKGAGRVEVDLLGADFEPGYLDCPIVTPMFVSGGGAFNAVTGKLSAKLLFGDRDEIVVEDGDVYRKNLNVFADTLSTTSVRMKLTRTTE